MSSSVLISHQWKRLWRNLLSPSVPISIGVPTSTSIPKWILMRLMKIDMDIVIDSDIVLYGLGIRKREVSNVSQCFHRFFHCRTYHDIKWRFSLDINWMETFTSVKGSTCVPSRDVIALFVRCRESFFFLFLLAAFQVYFQSSFLVVFDTRVLLYFAAFLLLKVREHMSCKKTPKPQHGRRHVRARMDVGSEKTKQMNIHAAHEDRYGHRHRNRYYFLLVWGEGSEKCQMWVSAFIAFSTAAPTTTSSDAFH